MPSLKLSIIIISYNTKAITLSTLKSVYKHTKNISFEVIVIDNDSKDGSIEVIKQFAKSKTNLIFKNTGKNPGFGTANNYGASLAKGEYLLFLNSDTLFISNILPLSIQKLANNPNIGIYSCRLLNPDKSIQPSGGFFPTLWRIFAWQLLIDDLPIIGDLIHSIHPHSSFYAHPLVQLDWVTGAFMIMPKKVFEKLHGFDENIFMYTEEMELCYRARQRGYKVYFDPKLSLIHLGGASSSSVGSFFSITSEIKYTLYFFQKHKPLWQLPLVKLLIAIGSIIRLIIFGVIRNNKVARQSYSYVFRHLA